jgi:saccharopine dehydrogenase-like protein
VAAPVVLILGGYGVFGRRIAANLVRHGGIDVIVAGRNAVSAGRTVRAVGADRARFLAVNLSRPDAIAQIVAQKPAVVVDALGPFQSRNLALPRKCAERGIHYVDISDARARVVEIASLDSVARLENCAIVSGASTVPAFTTAIVDELVPNPREVVAIDVGISPGHRTPRGLATVSAILSYCGRPIPPICGHRPAYGWGDLTRHDYPEPVGERWLSNVDTPERALWRKRYPALEEANVRAGFEIGILHLALSGLSRGVRAGVLPGLVRCAKPFLKIADLFDALGTDSGAMHVEVLTRDANHREGSASALLIAEQGDGPQVPAAPPALLVKKLLGFPGYAPLEKRGAFPCIGLLTRAEIMNELAGFVIRYEAGR